MLGNSLEYVRNEMRNYDLLMISTCTNDKYVRGLLSSLLYNQDISLCLVLLFQNNQYVDTSSYQTKNVDITPLFVSDILSLSQARNIGIKHVIKVGLKFKYAMFPDDDSSFDLPFFANFQRLVLGNTLIDVYCTGTKRLYQPTKYRNYQCVTNNEAAMSVNIIVDNDTFLKVGLFDEMMGVGAPYGSGEDGDYFLRACMVSGKGFYMSKELWSFHPAPTTKYAAMSFSQLKSRYINYGRGMAYLYCKHGLYSRALRGVLSGFLGMLIAFSVFNVKLGRARFYGFIYRLVTFIDLFFRNKLNT